MISRCGGGALAFPGYDGDYFYFELYAGTGHRLRESGGSWDFAPAVPGQPDSTTWCNGLIGVADAQLGPDGALYLAALGYTVDFPRGLHRIRPDPAAVGADVAAHPFRLLTPPSPNPFRDRTTFAVRNDRHGPVRVTVTDVAGRAVRHVHAGDVPAGPRALSWDGRDDGGRPVPSGVYFLNARTASGTGRAKVVLLR